MSAAGTPEAGPRFKLLTIIVNDQDVDRVLHALVDAGWPGTKIASSGGFLRRESSTIMVGVPETDVDSVIGLVRELAASRVERVSVHPPTLLPILGGTEPQGRTVDVHIAGALIFVLDVERFERF